MSEPLLDQLPAAWRDGLIALGCNARSLLGRPRKTQDVVDQHIDFIEGLLEGGLSYGEIAQLLDEVGVLGTDKKTLRQSTLSSAVSRSRQRGIAVERGEPREPAGGRSQPQDNAVARGLLQGTASSCGRPPVVAASSNMPPVDAARGGDGRADVSTRSAANGARDGPAASDACTRKDPTRVDDAADVSAQRTDHSVKRLRLLRELYK